jgi:hypothetical protein
MLAEAEVVFDAGRVGGDALDLLLSLCKRGNATL